MPDLNPFVILSYLLLGLEIIVLPFVPTPLDLILQGVVDILQSLLAEQGVVLPI